MRLVCLLTALLLLAGCAPEPVKQGRTLVGRWEVTGQDAPIVQTFSEGGQYTSESPNELPLESGEKITATIIVKGGYKYDGKKLYTTTSSIDVTGAPEPIKENLVHNSKENLGKSYSVVLEWQSDDKIVAKGQHGEVLVYTRK